MGGNTISSPSRVRTPTVTPRERKINKLLSELRELSPSERKSALSALRKSGQKELADSLEALMPKKRTTSSGGSRPAERPSSGPSRPK